MKYQVIIPKPPKALLKQDVTIIIEYNDGVKEQRTITVDKRIFAFETDAEYIYNVTKANGRTFNVRAEFTNGVKTEKYSLVPQQV